MLDTLKSKGIAAGVVALGLAGAYSVGRFTGPVKVETHETVKTVTVHDVVTKTVEVEKKTTDKAQVRVIYRDRIIKPDGTRVEHTEARTLTESEVRDQTAKQTDKAESSSSQTDTERVSITTLRPSWGVSLLVGVDFNKPWIQIYGPLTLGIEVDYRIAGGLSAGLWFNTGMAGGGLSARFEF